jgi:hypothetical protein
MGFLKFIVRASQILIGYEVIVLLYKTHNNYSSSDMYELVWWTCLLILDLWIMKTFIEYVVEKKENEDSI